VWFKPIDNIGLVLWRIVFGLLIALESFGALITGWVKEVLIEPVFTFSFIGFEWLQPLPGYGMYGYYTLMGLCGLAIMIGYRYRWSMLLFAVLWTGSYFMQKSAYNNHYYLLCLLSWLMVFLPAAKDLSWDARALGKSQNRMPSWVLILLIGQVWIVFTYAALAKLYPDWLDGKVIALFMDGKKNYPIIGPWLQNNTVQQIIIWGGIFFDALIIPALFWRRTRVAAFILSLGFHLFNSIVFQIGIFPYMSIAFALLFFSPQSLRQKFGRWITRFETPIQNKLDQTHWVKPQIQNLNPAKQPWIPALIVVYLVIQVLLPLRHHLIKDSVLWTEEGHRMSWRMMLRARKGITSFYVMEPGTGVKSVYPLRDLVTQKQLKMLSSHPDFIWQMAQKIKAIEAEKGREVGVYVRSRVSINGREYSPLIDPDVNLAEEPWDAWRHHDWILPSPF
jgi:vitamin K-dependent gamma-carboxylase